MTREPRHDAPPEPSVSVSEGHDGLPGDGMRMDSVAVSSMPRSALADRQQETRPANEVLAGPAPQPQTGASPAQRPSRPSRGTGVRPRRPSLGGGIPAQGRELGAQGRQTVRRLLEAGLVEFDERGFQAVRVDDVVRRAKTSHGTFYLYFANKDDLFRTLLRDALRDMESITDEFPVVTSNEGGRAALRRWIQSFTDTYAAHATVIRILSQAEIVGEQVYGDGLRLLFRLSEAIAQGMTVASSAGSAATAGSGEQAKDPVQHAELTALACLMMLERINYLLSVDVRLPREEMVDRLSAIIYAAFHTP
ncbi:MAG TPA: TetR/AcrR family transcriptional regulator [Streptosporangiaceae bacterium]|nr:TetR/AcrR family transcriptional regulator [Streptosporangiaceae bacterium]